MGSLLAVAAGFPLTSPDNVSESVDHNVQLSASESPRQHPLLCRFTDSNLARLMQDPTRCAICVYVTPHSHAITQRPQRVYLGRAAGSINLAGDSRTSRPWWKLGFKLWLCGARIAQILPCGKKSWFALPWRSAEGPAAASRK